MQSNIRNRINHSTDSRDSHNSVYGFVPSAMLDDSGPHVQKKKLNRNLKYRRLRVDSSFFATAIEILLWKEFKDKLFGPMEHRSWPCIMFRLVFFFFMWIKFATILSRIFFSY